MENLDATGHNEIFEDDDINFDLELKSFGVEMGPLKEPAVERVFRAWVEDWDKEARKKNVCIADLAGNVGDMSATCRRRVEMSPIFA
jgi:hypothetical protein